MEFVQILESFNSKTSDARVLDLSRTFVFNKRHQPSEPLPNSNNISGCQFAHHEGVCGALIITAIILNFGSVAGKCSASCSGRFTSA